ncbi:nitroreductase family protein [Actinomadura hibisca]|uniref:nitroreductase family protein n=1 Tax=Actinomadura hibisca TaxID=68565 RepID=UPI00082CB0E8|nr:nitroreductase family protein [Actinomadura hibisca]
MPPLSPAVRLADAAARGPYDGHRPDPRGQPRYAVADPGTALPRYPASQVLGPLLDLALAAESGRVRPRRVPSAGALYPVDAHVLHEGTVHRYDPVRHALTGWPSGTDTGAFVVVLSLVPERTRWKYGARALPSLLLDLGHAVAALAASAAALDVPCQVWTDPDARCLAALTGAPYSLAAVRIGTPPDLPSPPPAPRPLPTGDLVTDALTDLSPGSPAPGWTDPGQPRHPADVLLARRSADSLTGHLSSADLDALLHRTPLVAATADGLRDASGPIARGDARPVLAAWSGGGPAIAEAAAVLLFTAPLDDYRREHTDAGRTVHRAVLEATARGLAARPVGSWSANADLGAALGRPSRRSMVVHALAVGGRARPAQKELPMNEPSRAVPVGGRTRPPRERAPMDEPSRVVPVPPAPDDRSAR